MAESLASSLLKEAEEIYDNPLYKINLKSEEFQGMFDAGAAWMAYVLGVIRGNETKLPSKSYNIFGLIKYGLCSIAGLLPFFAALITGLPVLVVLSPILFYYVEAHLVFLFPLQIDNVANPYFESLKLTQRAGGAVRVMFEVVQLAFVMIFGGFTGKGFARSWSLGCIAVLLWYERVKRV